MIFTHFSWVWVPSTSGTPPAVPAGNMLGGGAPGGTGPAGGGGAPPNGPGGAMVPAMPGSMSQMPGWDGCLVGAWFVGAICFFFWGEIYQINRKTRMTASWNIVGFLITHLASMAILSEHHGIAQWVSAYLRIAIFRFQMICVLDEFELVDVCF